MEISYVNLKAVKAKRNEAAYEAEVPIEALARHESRALIRMGSGIELPGFRKGKAPESMLRERINPVKLFEEAAESALRAAVRDILESEKLDVLGIPQLTLKQMETGRPVLFVARFALRPKIDLPDYRKIGREIVERKADATISEAEMHEAREHLRKMAARAATTGTSAGETAADTPLPELTDDLARTLGNFNSVAELESKLRGQLIEEKERRAHDLKRDEIIKAITDHAEVALPELLVDQELQRFEEHRDEELERAGLSLLQYLEQAKKSEKEFLKEERATVEARLKTSIVFNEIQAREDIRPDERAVVTNLAFLKRRYPKENPDSLRRTAEAFIIQEQIFKLFEPPASEAGNTN